MKDRLAQFLKSESLTAVKFAEIMEVQPSSISHLLSGRNKPNFEFISRMLLRFPNLNPDWMINGTGPVYRSEQKETSDTITDVTECGVTNVKSEHSTKYLQDTKDIRQGDGIENVNKILPSNDKDSAVTNVTNNEMEFVASSEPETTTAGSKSIERVIIFYSDGSFREYHN